MRIDWKTLSTSMIISTIIVTLSWLILSLSNIVLPYLDIYEYLQSQNLYSEKSSYTIAVSGGYGPPYVLHLWVIVTIIFISIIILTMFFYFIATQLKKHKVD